MKKLIFGLAAAAIMFASSSCTKCGYCAYPNGTNSSSVCKSGNPVLGGLLSEYDQAKKDCEAANGVWK